MNEYCEYKTIDQIKYKINKWINKLNRYRMNFILNDLFFFFCLSKYYFNDDDDDGSFFQKICLCHQFFSQTKYR